MASFNKVILLGNLTRDPELRYTPKGLAIARLGLALNRVWRAETGEQKEEATFVDVDAYGREAETLGKYLKKGRPVLIEGRLRQDTWEDKQTGQKRSKLLVVLERFQFVDTGAGRGTDEAGPAESRPRAAAPPSEGPSPAARPAEPAPPASTEPAEEAASEDDVPF
jgi:single-strand DNA-binding protein